MGRHSGFWMLVALTAVTAVATTLRLPAGGPSIPGEGFTHHHPPALPSGFMALQKATQAVERAPANSHTEDSLRSVTLTSIPAGSVIVIGSLDMTGARHTVRINIRPGDPTVESAESFQAPVRLFRDEVRRELVGWGHSDAKPPSVLEREHGTDREPYVVASPVVRHFLIPHFANNATEQQPAAAVRIAESARVAVFVDAALCDSANDSSDADSRDAQNALAQRICARLESNHLDQVTHWIGPVSDIDCDRRLTIVLTELDRRSMPEDTPILGCVRDRDFAPSGFDDGLEGDIIYLNHRLPDGDELDALLVHELAHAAICCLRISLPAGQKRCAQAPKISAWLNEAVAHVLEMKLAASSTGFADRIERFQSDPATCPIVADDSHLPLVARRGGSRAAAALFLMPHIDSPDDIAALLDERCSFSERVQTISGRSFSDEFRAWCICNASWKYSAAVKTAVDHQLWTPTELPNGAQSACRLYGTAFVAFQCRESLDRINITSDTASQLQITILE